MVTAGERYGTGFYFCIQCGHRVHPRVPNALAINLTKRLPKRHTANSYPLF